MGTVMTDVGGQRGHSPGPWSVTTPDAPGGMARVVDATGDLVALVTLCNAPLVVNAPELLAEVKAALAVGVSEGILDDEEAAATQALINDAEGLPADG